MRKIYFILGFTILLMGFKNGLYIEDEKTIEESCSIDNEVFQNKEVLVYKLYYNWKLLWLPAGEVKFEVKESENYYEFFAKGITYKSYDSFFKVRDYYYSKVNKETLFPEVFVRNVEEGKYLRYDSIVFDQNGQEAVSYWGRNRADAKQFDFGLDGCRQDMLSILYYVRNYNYSDFQKGDKVPIDVFFDKETYPLKVRYDGKEKKKKIKNLGKFKTMVFTPQVVAGYVFDEDTTMKLWVSDDENKIPLLIESPVSIGSIKAVLKRYENLRHDLTSQISE